MDHSMGKLMSKFKYREREREERDEERLGKWRTRFPIVFGIQDQPCHLNIMTGNNNNDKLNINNKTDWNTATRNNIVCKDIRWTYP